MNKILKTIILLLPYTTTSMAQNDTQNYVKAVKAIGEGQQLITIQYYDGWGRPFEKVMQHFSPDGSNLAYLTEYDGLGREKYLYLPMKTTEDYVSSATLKQAVTEQYNDQHPYSENIYDSSPLDRITEVPGAGNPWYRHKSATGYLHNTEVFPLNCKDYYVSASKILTVNGYYRPGTLYVKKRSDEDGKTLYEFMDMQGRTLLVRKMIDKNTSADTYYVYNNRGNLVYVLQPEFQDNEDTGKFAFRYEYDARRNITKKNFPGADAVTYRYDKAGRLIFSQDGVQREKNIASIMLYDIHDRNVLKAECHAGNMTDVSAMYVTATFSNSQEGICGTGYTTNITLTNVKLEFARYYDTYGFLSLPAFSGLDIPNINGNATGYETGMVIAVLGNTKKQTVTVNRYDIKGNKTWTMASNHLDGRETWTYKYNIAGNITETEHTHTAENRNEINEKKTYTYDNTGRLSTITYKLNDAPEMVMLKNYYDGLGRMVTKEILGKETVRYTYNIKNLITKISSEHFSQNINYYDCPYSCYNGNIARTTWKAPGDSDWRGYLFRYDGMNRLVSATYAENMSQQNNKDRYSTEYTYDKNGNMLTLSRNGKLDIEEWGQVDDIMCLYNGNHLTKADDKCDRPYYKDAFHFTDMADEVTEYEYDKNGNMTKDMNKGITRIRYNSMNLPESIVQSNGSITYMYNAAGEKLQVTYGLIHPAVIEPATDGAYMRTSEVLRPSDDIDSMSVNIGKENPSLKDIVSDNIINYCGNIIYDRDKTIIINDVGYVTFSDSTPVYHYFLKDHLGNNRVVINGDGETVEQVSHYYPYGGVMADICIGGDTQRYKYNGKELDRMHGLEWYDYGARHYDCPIGRWPTMDLLCEKYYDVSPYVYCGDNPVNAIDPDGEKVVLVGSREQRMLILGQMQKLTNDKLGVRRSTGEVIIMSRGTKNLNRSLKTGTSLISSVINNKHTTTVELTTGDSKTHPVYRLDKVNGKGTDSQILYNIGDNPSVLTKDNATGKIYEEAIPSHIVLGHELIHGHRNMNGTATHEDIMKEYEYIDAQGNRHKKLKKQDELETVGIINDERNKEYTENKLRKEQNLNIRIQY